MTTWITPAGFLFTATESVAVSSRITATNTLDILYQVISGSLPPGLALLADGRILGTPSPVIESTKNTFVVRANSVPIADRTFSIDVAKVDQPIWLTSSTYLAVGPDSEQWALNNQYVNYQLFAQVPGFSPAQTKVAIFGDSVSTYGGLELIPGADPTLQASYLPNQKGSIFSTIKKLYQPYYEIINVSRGGMTTSEALGLVPSAGENPFGASGTITQWIIDNAPNKIILRYGLADAVIINNSTTTLNNLQTIINFAKARGIEVILIGVNPAAPDGDPANPGYFPGYYSSSQENTAIAINNGIITKALEQGLKYANPRVLSKPADSLPDGIHPFVNFGIDITNEISNQLKTQIPLEEQNIPPGYLDLPAPFKLRYFIKDGNGILPPGLTLSENGVISGFVNDDIVFDGGSNLDQGYDVNTYDEFSYDYAVNQNLDGPVPLPNIYTFKVTASDGVSTADRLFNILVVTPGIIRSSSTNVMSIPSSVLTTDSNYVPPLQFINGSDLGSVRSATEQILDASAYDPYPLLGTATYTLTTTTSLSTQLPEGFSFDSQTGFFYGYIPYQPAYTKKYKLTVNATKEWAGNVTTVTNTFDLAIKGLVESSIRWVTTGSLGSIYADELSELAVKAETQTDYDIKYILVSGSLPEGLTLLQDGSIAGRASTSTIGKVFTATVLASDVYELSGIEQDFTLEVKGYDFNFTQIYVKPFLSLDKRRIYQEFINNEETFPQDYLYRYFDPHFGLQQEIKMYLEFAIERVDLREYVPALRENFYRRRFYFGDLKVAIAQDSNGNNLYEVVYLDIIDDLINSNNQSVSRVIYDNNNIYFPGSVTNMRKSLANIVLPDYSAIGVTDNFLPKFMVTIQPDEFAATGFTRVVPICYAKPGFGRKIISRIKETGFDFKQFDFDIDRIIVEDSLDYRATKYLLFSRQSISDPLVTDDFLIGGDEIIVETEQSVPLERE